MCVFKINWIFMPNKLNFFSFVFIPSRELSKTLAAATAKSLQLCPTLCDAIDGRPSGPTVPGILQARTLEWVAISSPMHESEK